MTPSKSVLVTGASGMLGKALIQKLSSDYKVSGLSKSGTGGHIACDMADAEALGVIFKSVRPDWVVNTAAYSDVDGCERDPGLALESNAHSVKNLARLCEQSGAPLVHVSTDYVFDGMKNTLYEEEDPTGPVNIYGMTKLAGERYALGCRSFSAVVRTSWLFGHGNPKNFVSVITERLKKEKEVPVLDDQTDCPTSVQDLSQVLCLIGERFLSEKSSGKPPRHVIYQVCNEGATTRYDMTVEIKKILGLDGVRVLKTDRASIRGRLAVRPVFAAMSCQRFEKEYRMSLRPWQEALAEHLGSAEDACAF